MWAGWENTTTVAAAQDFFRKIGYFRHHKVLITPDSKIARPRVMSGITAKVGNPKLESKKS